MQSMDEIYQRYAKIVYGYLFSEVHNHDIAEELTQETFYHAIRSIDKYDKNCKITTWLCGIAKNCLRTYLRKHPKMDELEQEYQMVSPVEQDVFTKLSQIELLKRLHHCKEPFREICYLRIFGNLSFKEIGEVLGKSENWARVTYYRGKEKLRKEIEEDEK